MTLPRILRTISLLNIILLNNGTVWCRFDFMVNWFWPVSWRLFDGWTSYFEIMSECDTKINIIINVCHGDLYFVVQWFCLLVFIFCFFFALKEHWQDAFQAATLIFIWLIHSDLYCTVQWFCFTIWRVFPGWTSYFGIMSQCDARIDHILYVGYSDLYFVVQWFCLLVFFAFKPF